ncbi:MAG: type II toxin-antitoxin system PemK/MazF family toxin [Anaerolineae bacterium]
MKPGDLVLLRFPQSNLQQGKLRPALVLAVAPGQHADVLLALVTSRGYQAVAGFDEVVEPTDPDFALNSAQESFRNSTGKASHSRTRSNRSQAGQHLT